MLKLSCFFISTFASAVAIAQSPLAPIQVGQFSLTTERGAVAGQGCSIGMKLTLDEAKVMGPVAFMSSFVNGNCELYVEPNPRYFQIESFNIDACGSSQYTGTVKQGHLSSIFTITDNRKRTCDDVIPSLIFVKEVQSDRDTRQTEETLYYSID